MLRSELAAAHCELQRAADDLSRMADAAPTVVNGDHDAAVEALVWGAPGRGAARGRCRRTAGAPVRGRGFGQREGSGGRGPRDGAGRAGRRPRRGDAHEHSKSPDGSEVERLTQERDEARKERDAFRDALGEGASAQAQGLKQEQDKSLRVAAKRADETKKEGAEAQRALERERRDRRDADAERETALRVARTAWLATRQRLLAVVVSERARADRNKKRYKACEADLDKAHERSRRLRAEVDALKRLPPRPPPTPPHTAGAHRAAAAHAAAHGAVPAHRAHAGRRAQGRRRRLRRRRRGGAVVARVVDAGDADGVSGLRRGRHFSRTVGRRVRGLASSPPLVAGRKKYRG